MANPTQQHKILPNFEYTDADLTMEARGRDVPAQIPITVKLYEGSFFDDPNDKRLTLIEGKRVVLLDASELDASERQFYKELSEFKKILHQAFCEIAENRDHFN